MERVNRHPYQLKINVLFHNNDTVIKMYLFKVPDYSWNVPSLSLILISRQFSFHVNWSSEVTRLMTSEIDHELRQTFNRNQHTSSLQQSHFISKVQQTRVITLKYITLLRYNKKKKTFTTTWQTNKKQKRGRGWFSTRSNPSPGFKIPISTSFDHVEPQVPGQCHRGSGNITSTNVPLLSTFLRFPPTYRLRNTRSENGK